MSTTATTPPQQPEMQFAVYVGEVGPNNTDNVFSDYQKLIKFFARRVTPEDTRTIPTGTIQHDAAYFLFGSRDGKSYMKHIDAAEATRFMVETFETNMKRAHVEIEDPQPLKPL